jgi:hypothetical protein
MLSTAVNAMVISSSLTQTASPIVAQAFVELPSVFEKRPLPTVYRDHFSGVVLTEPSTALPRSDHAIQ